MDVVKTEAQKTQAGLKRTVLPAHRQYLYKAQPPNPLPLRKYQAKSTWIKCSRVHVDLKSVSHLYCNIFTVQQRDLCTAVGALNSTCSDCIVAVLYY